MSIAMVVAICNLDISFLDFFSHGVVVVVVEGYFVVVGPVGPDVMIPDRKAGKC